MVWKKTFVHSLINFYIFSITEAYFKVISKVKMILDYFLRYHANSGLPMIFHCLYCLGNLWIDQTTIPINRQWKYYHLEQLCNHYDCTSNILLLYQFSGSCVLGVHGQKSYCNKHSFPSLNVLHHLVFIMMACMKLD